MDRDLNITSSFFLILIVFILLIVGLIFSIQKIQLEIFKDQGVRIQKIEKILEIKKGKK